MTSEQVVRPWPWPAAKPCHLVSSAHSQQTIRAPLDGHLQLGCCGVPCDLPIRAAHAITVAEDWRICEWLSVRTESPAPRSSSVPLKSTAFCPERPWCVGQSAASAIPPVAHPVGRRSIRVDNLVPTWSTTLEACQL